MNEVDWGPIDRGNPRGAVFDSDRVYRYKLWREWDISRPTVAFVMLNPSTADEYYLDPTCTRCLGFAQRWGYGKMLIGNIFALRSTDPSALYNTPDPVGPENDDYLQEICDDAEKVIAAWGNHGQINGRGREVVELLDADLYALDVTQEGHPGHPLYQLNDTEPKPFTYRDT